MRNSEELMVQTIEALKSRHMSAVVFESPSELIQYLEAAVKGKTVGVGDSVSLEQLGVYEALRQWSCHFLDKYEPGLESVQKKALYRENFSADVFLSGINAISATGKIYNLDGNGSRVAPILYGPDSVYLITGTNKFCESDEAAVQRVRNTAAPLDTVRLGKKTPCAKTGYCMDCKSPDRICNYLTVIEGQFNPERIKVLIVKGDYGY